MREAEFWTFELIVYYESADHYEPVENSGLYDENCAHGKHLNLIYTMTFVRNGSLLHRHVRNMVNSCIVRDLVRF